MSAEVLRFPSEDYERIIHCECGGAEFQAIVVKPYVVSIIRCCKCEKEYYTGGENA